MKKKNNLKKFLALVLAAAMIVTYMPSTMSVFAEEQAEAAASEAKAAAAEEVKAEPAPAAEEKAEPAPAAEEKAEPAPAAEEKAEPAPAAEENAEPAPAASEEAAPASESEAEAAPEDPAPAGTEESVTEEKAAEDEAKEEKKEELEYPALKGNKTVDNMTVYVSAPEGAFPEGTSVSISPVSAESIKSEVQSLKGENAEVVKAVDISFRYKGKEIEPKDGLKVSVRFQSSEIAQAESPSIVHIPDGGAAEPVSANISGNKAAFNSGEFSIYAVVADGSTDEDARLAVNFVQAGGGDPVTVYVKKQDVEQGKLNKIVYDPGAGELSDDQVFLGWTDDKDYTSETDAIDIAGIRSAVETKVNGGVAEGDEVTYYAMVFDVYRITYLKEKNVAIGEDKVYVRSDADDKTVSYEISKGYTSTDQEHNFEGWLVTAGKSNIVDYEDKLYEQGDSIKISGSVTFSVEEAEGHWLVFNENGRGATYYPPMFIKAGEPTSDPVTEERPMIRKGYAFDGWYTAAEGGSKFVFGEEISDFTTVYAHWTPLDKANYTIIIWKENVNGDGYDFEESIQIENADTGSTPDAVSGTSGNKSANINGTSYGWTGFHYKDNDQAGKTVEPDGSTVVNVHFDRDVIRIVFYTTSDGGCSRREGDYTNLYKELEGKYGERLEVDDWPGEYVWTDRPNGEGTRLTFLDAYLPADGSNLVKLYGGDPGSQYTATVEFYKQTVSGDYELANSVMAGQNSTFYITDKYTGYSAYQYSTDNGKTWKDVDPKDPTTGNYGNGVNIGTKLMIRFNRNVATLAFLNGSYYSDDKFIGKTAGGNAAATVKDLIYGDSIEEYADIEPDISEPGYTFAGWYIDDTCSQPYEFTTVPEAGAVVYAKWIATQYRVFLHPNAEDADFGEGQEMDFRVDYGDRVGNVTGIRTGFDFAGWYLDEGLTKPFNANAFVLNDDTVTTPYTDKIDSDKDRFWITRKLDLYAKWSAHLDGADGITVAYDADDVKDTNLYVDGADAVTASATKNAPEGKKFDHWELTHKDGSVQKLYPGNQFVVYKDDAVEEIIERDDDGNIVKATYTVTLVPKYVDAEEETTTTITYDPNGGSGDAITDEVKINETLTAKAADTFTRDGYEFVEWNTQADGSGDSFKAGEKIAADILDRVKNSKDNILYAQWEKVAKLTYDANGGSGKMDPQTGKVGDEVTISQNGFTRDGYEFKGWNTAADGNGTDYNAGDPFTLVEEDSVLYAQWESIIKEVSVRINGNRVEKEYNGDYQNGEKYTLTWFVDGEEVSEAPEGVSFKNTAGVDYPNGKNVKEYNASINGEIVITDTSKYKAGEVSVDDDYKGITHLVITPAPLTVKLTGNTDTVDYDGKTHNVMGLTFEVEGLKGSDTKDVVDYISGHSAASVAASDVGTHPMNMKAEDYRAILQEGNNNYTTSVEIAKDGWLKIEPASITIVVKGTEKNYDYDGSSKTAEGYTATSESALFDESKLSYEGEKGSTGIDAGEYPYDLAEDGFTYDDDNVEVTYQIKGGKLKIDPAKVTITTGSAEKVYDGEALTNDEASIEGLAEADAEKVTVKATGSQTEVGSSDNTYEIDWGDANKDNYEVTEELGTLTVNPVETADITYDLNGGEYDGSTDDIVETYEIGEEITIHAAPTREGYEFQYWKGSQYDPGDSYIVEGDHTFTAIWEAKEDVDEEDDEDDEPDVDEEDDEDDEPDADTDDGDGNDSKKGDSSKGIKTGDESGLVGLLGLMGASIAGFIALFFRRRREQE